MLKSRVPRYFQWAGSPLSLFRNIEDLLATAQRLFSGAAERRKLPWVSESKSAPTSKKLKQCPPPKRYSTENSEEPRAATMAFKK